MDAIDGQHVLLATSGTLTRSSDLGGGDRGLGEKKQTLFLILNLQGKALSQ